MSGLTSHIHSSGPVDKACSKAMQRKLIQWALDALSPARPQLSSGAGEEIQIVESSLHFLP